MPKIIVFCADGTWNGPSEPDDNDPAAAPTNVFKLFINLAGVDSNETLVLADEQERVMTSPTGGVLQHAKYLHGVGDSKNYLARLVGGTLGAGLVVRIIRGYTFVSRVYEPGDKIFLVGFSRGAYTVRALAGLIADQGLMDATKLDLRDKEDAYRLGAAVWSDRFRRTRARRAGVIGDAERFVLELPGFFSRPPPATAMVTAPIEAVAVWDTVGALGIPAFNLHLARIDLLQFTDTKLSPVVRHGLHAVSIDEQRSDFTPTLWDPDPRITQVLFPGAHSDVGGGYTAEESGLSNCGLAWMTAELAGLGVRFEETPIFNGEPDAIGPAHQPWTVAPWVVLPRAARTIPAGLSLSKYAVMRLGGGSVMHAPGTTSRPWRPANLATYIQGTGAAPGVSVV